jgi:hypothetical protein
MVTDPLLGERYLTRHAAFPATGRHAAGWTTVRVWEAQYAERTKQASGMMGHLAALTQQS